MKRILPLALLLVSAAATAGTGVANLTWTNPTVYVDGTTLPASAIAETQVYCEFTPTGSTATASCTAAAPAVFAGSVTTGVQTFTFPAQGGKACWYLRTRVGTAVSDPSSPKACKDFLPLAPNAPAGVTVTVTVTIGP